jgi:hypothetical protein
LVVDDTAVMNMDAIEDAEEILDTETQEQTDGDVVMRDEINEEQSEDVVQPVLSQDELDGEVPGPPPFRVAADRSPEE